MAGTSSDARPRLTISLEEAARRLDLQVAKPDEFLPSGVQRVTREVLFGGRKMWSDYTSASSAGINRHVVGNERVLQERRKRIHLGPESCGWHREVLVEA